jgi:putative ABC transport system substrate-binding protein
LLRILIALMALALPASAQTAGERIYRLGELAPNAASLGITRAETIPELARLGFVEGRNLRIDERAGDAATLEQAAGELAQTRPDAIIAIGPDAIDAAARATRSVPIVTFGADPVQAGFASSFAHPGGNVTGIVILAEELDGKRLDLLHAAVPGARRVAALVLPSVAYRVPLEKSIRKAADGDHVELLTFLAEGPAQYPAAFAAMRAKGVEALLITGNPTFNRDAEMLARLALAARLPTMCEWAENAHAGCLLGYGPNRGELRRTLARYVARLFEGAAPGDLPIETPTHFRLAVNLATAKALDLEVPMTVLMSADETFE